LNDLNNFHIDIEEDNEEGSDPEDKFEHFMQRKLRD